MERWWFETNEKGYKESIHVCVKQLSFLVFFHDFLFILRSFPLALPFSGIFWETPNIFMNKLNLKSHFFLSDVTKFSRNSVELHTEFQHIWPPKTWVEGCGYTYYLIDWNYKMLDRKPPCDWLGHLHCTQKRLTPLQTLANYSVNGSETLKNGKWSASIFTVKVGPFVRHNLHSEGQRSPSSVCIVLFYYYYYIYATGNCDNLLGTRVITRRCSTLCAAEFTKQLPATSNTHLQTWTGCCLRSKLVSRLCDWGLSGHKNRNNVSFNCNKMDHRIQTCCPVHLWNLI